jgi:dipeptidyl aminopeptidase/acylaminoacyl peptidase
MLIATHSLNAQTQKKPLDHSVYNSWINLQKQVISNNGNWVAYELNPQDGDGKLIIHNTTTLKTDTIERGTGIIFSSDESFAAYTIKPSKAEVRAANKAKKKKEEMPADKLGVLNLKTGKIETFEGLKSFEVPKKVPGVIALHIKTPAAKPDSTVTPKDTVATKKAKPKATKKDETGRLIFYSIQSNTQKFWDEVASFSLPENSNALFVGMVKGDSLKQSEVIRYEWATTQERTIFTQQGTLKDLTGDKKGNQAAWLFTPDTAKVKTWTLAWYDGKTTGKIIADSLTSGMPAKWCPSEHQKPRFSEQGTRLFFGLAPIPRPEPKDTLLDDEKYKLDIWHWKDPLLQPQQLKGLEREKKKNWMAVFHTKEQKLVLLQDSLMNTPEIAAKGEAKQAIVTLSHQYLWHTTYDIRTKRDVFVIDPLTGKKQLLLEGESNPWFVSPDGNYLLLYNVTANTWFSYNLKTLTKSIISNGLNINFADEDNDVPLEAGPYGVAGWLEKETGVLVYDRYDIWLLDPTGKNAPLNYTNGYGRKNNIKLRYVKTDEEATHIAAKQPLLLEGFHYANKQAGFFELTGASSEPKKLIWEAATFTNPKKASNSGNYIFTKGDFKTYPELHISNTQFGNAVIISNSNPQMEQYRWGNVELVEWVSYNGDSLQGLLYTPETMEPGKKYPMLVYFYERSSDDIYRHMVPAPSRSIINRAYCTSNDYVVFIPDIVYRNGSPGQSAYDAIISGTHSLLERYPFIDRNKMGLQGQSWGGYQIAYLVTKTNMFACAMAGAPVSNMTSAYGGIRWESGRVRQFQYEQTQSRIGGTLWEKPREYIENSPLFYADRVNTPLLMMANDNDGAVPWYQGIEYFTALRRLNKPVWMLVYNGEDHNLTKRPNMHDLTIRMYQFFDHFLKNQPAPLWLKDGIPAIDKGVVNGY